MTDWQVPRCAHGHILLGCPHDDCEEQNRMIAITDAAVDAHYQSQQQAAKDFVADWFKQQGLEVPA